ncbi:Poly(U)-specific endoribonuclease-B [Bienertia sinuspersici]
MDGLIKGLVDVAIGHNDRRNDDDQNNSESLDERSRSTWAQVVTGEQDNDHNSSSAAAPQSQTHSRYNVAHGENYGVDDENSEFRRSRPQQNEQEEDNDGWQTAHKKHHRRPQRVHMDHWGSYKSPPDEQQYTEEVQDTNEMEPSEAELSDYKRACAKLWKLDFNRLTPGQDYEIDVGEGKRVHDSEDMAEASLFTWLSENVLRKPTFSRFCALLDNYNPHEGCKEKVTDEERREQAAFIEEISRTAPIKYLYKYLSSTGIFTENYQEFKRMLKDLWFTLYGRGGTCGSSSSFEHVFVGEIKERGEQQVSGFHNWLQFYLEEANGSADYQGYILPRRNEQFPDAETQLLTVQFEWNGVLKSLSSMFVGVSPEFELALYTLCFFAGDEDNHIEVGPYPVNIKCYRLGNKIGSAFPIAEA